LRVGIASLLWRVGNIIVEHPIRWSNRLNDILWHCVLVYSGAAEEGGIVIVW
jgi:hypothetical protein